MKKGAKTTNIGRFTAPFTLVLLLLLLFSAVSAPRIKAETVASEEGDQTVGSMLFELITFATGIPGATPEEWIGGSMSASPQLNEWYAIGVSRLYPDVDMTPYTDALENYLKNTVIQSAVTRQKYGLTLLACGKPDSEYLSGLVDETAGKQGIMSYVFALHLLSNGAASEKYTPENIIPTLLKLSCPDGGWSLTGKTADVDVTAMTVQALAPYYHGYEQVKTAVDAAILRLSAMQREDGGFVSYGDPNPESAAQVIIALLSLGRDPTTDPSFTKNGSAPLDAIKEYRLPDGSFRHRADGEYNLAATSQTFLALSALSHYRSTNAEGSPFFLFGDAPTEFPDLDNTVADTLPDNGGTQNGDQSGDGDRLPNDGAVNPPKNNFGAYKLPVCIGIIVSAVAVCTVMLIKKRRARSDYLLVGIVAAALCLAVTFIDVYTPEQYYGQAVTKDSPVGAVTLEIVCDTDLTGRNDAVILGKTRVEIAEGETVYDLLTQVCRANGLILDAMASSPTGGAYVRGIDGLHELAHGDLSGWTYTVNGTQIGIGCDKYVPADGDVIVWTYSNTLGN